MTKEMSMTKRLVLVTFVALVFAVAMFFVKGDYKTKEHVTPKLPHVDEPGTPPHED